jgi:iron complex transport system substrate-binding protein
MRSFSSSSHWCDSHPSFSAQEHSIRPSEVKIYPGASPCPVPKGKQNIGTEKRRYWNFLRLTASTEYTLSRSREAELFEERRHMQRVVSLIASATEIVCALDCEDRLVGRSHECDYPSSIRRLPVCSEPLIDPSRPSAEIDRQVKQVLRDALSVYRVHADVLRELQPDLVITQCQCEVCAVSLRDVEHALCTWLDSRPRLVSLEPDALTDIWTDIGHVAEALGVPERGIRLVECLKGRMAAIAKRAAALSNHPTVACIEWIDPLMAAGNWVPELVELAGGKNLFGEAGKHSPWMSWEQLVAQDPDVVVVMPCGFDIARSEAEMWALTQRPEWPSLRAVRASRVYVTDGNQYFNRPGPRLVESLEILAEVLHPGLFRFRHEGTGWQRAAETAGWA